jgi:hypothetical protein
VIDAPPSFWHRRNPRAAIALGVLVVAIVLDFAIGSIVQLRLFRRDEPLGDMLRVRRPDLYYHHGLVPNATADSARFGDAVYPIFVNSMGFRDARVRDIPLARPSSVRYRLLFIGDSFTEGLGVPWDSSFVGRVATALRGDSIEVLNAGTIANSPVIFERKLRYYLTVVGLQVDEVAAVADITDLGDEIGYRFPFGWDPDTTDSRPVWRRRFGEVMGYSLSYATARRIWHRRIELARSASSRTANGHLVNAWFALTYRHQLLLSTGFRLMDEHLEATRALLADRGIPLSVTTYPWPTMLTGAMDRESLWETHWRTWTAEHPVADIGLFAPWFAAADSAGGDALVEAEFFRGDAHWNARGHARTAQQWLRRWCVSRSPVAPRACAANL